MFHLPESAAETNAFILREVEQIVARGESEPAEFKRSTGQRTEAVRTVCALLNGSGGFVLFGVTDGGVLVGQDVSPETLESIVREILLCLAEHGPSSSVVLQGKLPGVTSNDRVIRSLQTLRHLRESAGICGNLRESAGICGNLRESAGIRGRLTI